LLLTSQSNRYSEEPNIKQENTMKYFAFNRNMQRIVVIAFASAILSPQVVMAQSSSDDDDVVEEIITVGSRSHRERSVSDSPVPIDILSAGDLNTMGGVTDITDNLKNLIPSYSATRAAGDTSAFVRPTSLRGTAPDQTMVLVNGKRRHRSSVIQFFAPASGSGSHGVDIGMIPSIALKRVEVLRDGASAQYGSDAIAGVINFVTRDNKEGGQYQIRYGNHYEGEANYNLSANQGFALGDNGFINVSLEYQDNDALSRAIQRPAAQENIDAGAVGVGADSPFGDAPLVQTFGRVESSGLRTFFNSGWDLNDNTSWYGRVGYADVTARYRFFYRALNAVDEALEPLVDLGYDGELLLTGYTPYLDGSQKDISVSTGFMGEFAGGTTWDASFGYGKNTMDLFLNREISPSLGLTPLGQIPQFAFNTGGYEQEELLFNVDLSTELTDSINVAYGVEWRDEAWTTNAGERNAWIDPVTGGEGPGVDGRIAPSQAGTWSRNNYAAYVDIEHDITDRFLLQYAARYEDYSDFGSVVTGKLAGRFRINDALAIRGAASTGFKAPTPGQNNVRATVSSVDPATGVLLIQGLVPVSDPRAIAAGATPIQEETTVNISGGITLDLFDNTNISVDAYQISVKDRIYRTDRIPADDGTTISFYTNALDVEHSGVDLVWTSNLEWGGIDTVFSFAYNYNKTDVTKVRIINGLQPVQEDAVEDIEINYPKNRFVTSLNMQLNDRWNYMVRANYYGEHFDTRGRVNGVDGELPSKLLNPVTLVDMELGYQATDNVLLKVGASNIFDQFPDQIGPPYANRLNTGLNYPSETPVNFEGGSWYFTAIYAF
jgi:iron complex outermembrane recepter protein